MADPALSASAEACMKRLIAAAGGTAGAAKYVPVLVARAKKAGVTDPSQIAYIIATAQHETDRFNTLYEYGDQAYFTRYDGRADLGNNQPGDGYRFRGRGFVQITGRVNYTKFQQKLGIDFVGEPDLAAKPDYAAAIAIVGMKEGSFTGASLSDYLGGGKHDFVNARKIINGLDRADLIAGYAQALYAILKTCTPW
jgi:predicted chitinase